MNKKKKFVLMLLGMIAILATRSNTGLIMLSIFILIIIFNNKRNKIFKGIIILLVFISVVFIIKHFNSEYFNRYINVFREITNANSISDMSTAFNGRFELYNYSIYLIKNNLLIGLGVNYVEELGQLAHNIILESLLQAGVFNTLILFLIFLVIIKRTNKNSKFTNLLGVNISVILILLNGMIEPNLFAFNFDFFFWIICGFGMSQCKYIENKDNQVDF
ncbi:O-antigen ligase family protein [Clostridium sp. 'White wine YQ']|uniref:O-antigen ligase family protein n=1 Tax=Clostridium sp. 'White wine YQ' TaxID=3027474 RepID=UPI0023654A1E|nr:O-antigen ligase family protein [Clostridium sp. 'White wine YQ']MDD7792773.1 O-antigen ligase family protein [Clostridium sp. 'White wine YQ']